MFLKAVLRIFDIVCLKNMIRVEQLNLKINWGRKYDPLSPKKGGNHEKQ
jgi:hypothetical protein